MTPEKKQKEPAKKSSVKSREIAFTCKYCEKSKPLCDMVVITRFSPPLIACKECEKKAF